MPWRMAVVNEAQEGYNKYHPEKKSNYLFDFLAIRKIEGFPVFLEDVCESWEASGAAWALGQNIYPLWAHSKIDISGSNETMQNALASIV